MSVQLGVTACDVYMWYRSHRENHKPCASNPPPLACFAQSQYYQLFIGCRHYLVPKLLPIFGCIWFFIQCMTIASWGGFWEWGYVDVWLTNCYIYSTPVLNILYIFTECVSLHAYSSQVLFLLLAARLLQYLGKIFVCRHICMQLHSCFMNLFRTS